MLRPIDRKPQVTAVTRPGVLAGCAVILGLVIALVPQVELATALATALALGAIAAIFHEPVLGLALALVAGPFQPLERISLHLGLDSGQIVLGITLVSYLARALATRRMPIARTYLPLTLALALFIIVCLVSFLPARDLIAWANECIKWLQVLVIALLVMNERDGRKRAFLIGAILLSGAGQAMYGIVQADVRGFGPREFQVLGSKTNFRAYGTFEQPNPFGGYMGLVWPLAASVALGALVELLIDPVGRARTVVSKLALAVIAVGIATMCLVALIASGSRGAEIGAMAAVVTMALVLLKHPWRWVGALALAGLLLAGLHVVNIPLALDAQVQEILALDVRDAHILPTTFSTIERLAHWQAAVRMIQANPWLGVGFGNYEATYPDYKLFIWDNALGHAHNYYLNIFAETGVIGLVAYFALWGTVFVAAWRFVRQAQIPAHLSLDRVLWSRLTSKRPQPLEWERRKNEARREIDRVRAASLAVGLLGAFAHVSCHHVFDDLYVANIHVLIGVYLGLLGTLWLERKRKSATIIPP